MLSMKLFAMCLAVAGMTNALPVATSGDLALGNNALETPSEISPQLFERAETSEPADDMSFDDDYEVQEEGDEDSNEHRLVARGRDSKSSSRLSESWRNGKLSYFNPDAFSTGDRERDREIDRQAYREARHESGWDDFVSGGSKDWGRLISSAARFANGPRDP